MNSVADNGSSPVPIDSFRLVGNLPCLRKRAGQANILPGAVAPWTAQRLVVSDLVAVAVGQDRAERGHGNLTHSSPPTEASTRREGTRLRLVVWGLLGLTLTLWKVS